MSVYGKLVKNPLVSTVMAHIEVYPTPINLTYLWGFGSLAGIALVIQIVTGALLAMHYAAEVHLAFASVEHIMRDVKGGVILRYIHANGASMFLLIVYSHMFRGLYYGSYYQPRANLWYSGVVIFLAMMATAFMGYVLPWGQMSFWGATVITNLFSAIPYIGDSIVQLLWGGFSVDNPTLNRFFSLHYFVPFLIAGLAFLHLILLHQPGSNNPLGVNAIYDRIPFYPYFYVKDLFGFFIFVWIFSFFVIYAPNYLGHPDNYIEANPLVTPAHIVPEWYFLPFYAILRSIPDKLGGVVFMVAAIAILAVLPVVDTSSFRSNFFKPFNIWMFWFFFADSISLGWIGQEIVETPFMEMGIFVTFCYFFHFIAILPFGGFLENAVINHELRLSSFFAFLNLNATTQSTERLRWDVAQEVIAKGEKSDFWFKQAAERDVWFKEAAKEHPEWFTDALYEQSIFPFVERAKVLKEYYTSNAWREFSYDFKTETFWFNGKPNTDVNNVQFIWDWKDTIFAHFKWVEFYQVSFVFLFLLSLSLFFSRRGEFTRFINKLSFAYLIFVFWRFSFETVLNAKEFGLQIMKAPHGRFTVDVHTTDNPYTSNISSFFNTPVVGGENVSNWFLHAQNTMSQGMYEWAPLYNFISDESIFAKLFALYAILIVSIFFYGVSDRFFVANSYEIEFTLLVFFSHLGALFLFSVENFIEFVLAIEIVTLATYALTAFDRRSRFSTHAGVQYFILGSIPSGLLVLGLALIYKSWGTLGFDDLDLLLTNVSESTKGYDSIAGLVNELTIVSDVNSVSLKESTFRGAFGDIPVANIFGENPTFIEMSPDAINLYDNVEIHQSIRDINEYNFFNHGLYNPKYYPVQEIQFDWTFFDRNVFPELDAVFAASAPYSFATLAAIFLIFFNFLFKITAAPFHFWAPSIYGKAPIASVTFLSIFSKAMIFFAIAKFLISIFHAYSFVFLPFLIFISVLSVLFGMIGAFAEKGIKRFFVYSSMGHVGFMLLGLSLSTREGLSATFHYLPVYIITSFIMWFILMYLGEEKNQLIHFSILKNSNPLLALIFSLIIFSMSGIPPLGGFFVKLDVLSALLESSKFYTNYILLLFTVASFFYYLRVVKIIFFDKSRDFSMKVHGSEERLWMISLLFIILLFYLFLVEKPLLEIQLEALSSLY